MSRTTSYFTTVTWKGQHEGHIELGNGPEMDFSAPPDSQGMHGVLTPEDAFVGAVNSCIMLMFIWACERLKIRLAGYRCRAEGIKQVELDQTESFVEVRLAPVIQVLIEEELGSLEHRIHKAIKLARKYSLVASSIKSAVSIDPVIEWVR